MNYVAEVSPVVSPLPTGARMFVLIVADSDTRAIDAVQALGVLRHDRPIQVDLFQRDGSSIGRKVWSGLNRVKPGQPMLSVVA
jgi:hypothetical protein